MNAPYSKELMKHFKHPKFVKKLKNPDGVGEVGNIACGDIMHLEIKVQHHKGVPRKSKILQGAKSNDEIITDIGFQTFGCPAAVASSDVVCEIAKGKTIAQAKKLDKRDIIKKLGEMPPIKVHCSILGIEALRKAIKDYENGK